MPSKVEAAFTLLELLIAVAVFAIVLATINGIFYGALRLRNKATEAIDESLPLQQAIPIIKRDLANLAAPGRRLAGPLQTGALSNAWPGQVSPAFYSASGAIDDLVPFGDIQQVAYLLVEPTNRLAPGRDLVRAVTRNLLALDLQPPTQQWLLSNVQAVNFLFFDGLQWVGAWDTTVQTNLPKAIKVEIQLAQQGNAAAAELAPIELVVPLDAQVRTNQNQQSASGGSQ